MLNVDVRSADAGMDAFSLGEFERIDGGINVFFHGPGERANDGAGDGLTHLYNRLEIAGGGDGKTGFDHVHAEDFELPGNLDFFHGVELAAGGLLAVAEGGVEDLYSVGHGWSLWWFRQ